MARFTTHSLNNCREHRNQRFLKYLGVVGEREPFTSESLGKYVNHLRERGVGVSGLISNLEGVLAPAMKLETE